MYGSAKCIICNKEFQKLSGIAKCCGKECRKKHNLNKMQIWHKKKRGHEFSYRQVPEHKRRWNLLRKSRRHKIYDIWGRRNDWRLAEQSLSLQILIKEGYRTPKLIGGFAPFDVVACNFEGSVVVFQVTTRTHIEKKHAHQLANDLRLIHKALFISTTSMKYIIKPFSNGGLAELNEGEVNRASRFV